MPTIDATLELSYDDGKSIAITIPGAPEPIVITDPKAHSKLMAAMPPEQAMQPAASELGPLEDMPDTPLPPGEEQPGPPEISRSAQMNLSRIRAAERALGEGGE